MDMGSLLRLLREWEYVTLLVASVAILSGVAIDFANKRALSERVVKQERNLVATLTMTLFFFAIFFVGRFAIGRLHLSEDAETTSKLVGCASVVFAAIVNIAARIVLGRFWSNQIEIVEGHRIVRRWPYSWSRHPMYGSLIVFGVGMGLLAINPLVIAATLLIFTPAMIYRARREERNLVDACGDEYRRFQSEVPMMLPRLPEWLSRLARTGMGAMQVWGAWFNILDLLLLSAVLTLGLSFIMQRDDFRIAYKIKPAVIVACVAVAARYPSAAIVLWIPALASIMSLTGQCPGTLLVRVFRKS